MTNYRRNFIEGGSCFFTLSLADRSTRLLIDNVELLRQSFRQTKKDLPFHIDSIVVLPEHLHCIWTLPDGDSDFSTRWKKIKARFSSGLQRQRKVARVVSKKGSWAYGNVAFWNIPCGMKRILLDMSNISIIIL